MNTNTSANVHVQKDKDAASKILVSLLAASIKSRILSKKLDSEKGKKKAPGSSKPITFH